MPWNINGEEEVRWNFVRARLRKASEMRALCRRFGISRECGHKWWRRFVAEGRVGLRERERAPHWAEAFRQQWLPRVLTLRRRQPDFGPQKLCWGLRQCWSRGPWPAPRTVGRWLAAAGKVRRRVHRPPAGPVVSTPKPAVAIRPNDVWSVDLKGWFLTGDRTRVCPLTVRDMASRCVLAVRHVHPAKEPQVGAVLRTLFRRHGRPRAIKVDNGAPFGGPGPRGWTALTAAWIRLGLRVEFSRPGCPQDNGAHEQMHRVLKKATASPPAGTLRAQQRRFDLWRWRYNYQRPHAALQMRLPGDLYGPGHRQLAVPDWSYPSAWRQVYPDTKGRIRWCKRQRLLGQAFAGQPLGLKPIHSDILAVYFGPHLLGTLHPKDLAGLRPVRWRDPTHREREGLRPSRALPI